MSFLQSKIIPLIFIILGIVFFGNGIFITMNRSHLSKVCTESITATVTSCNKRTTRSSKGRKNTRYITYVSFSADGNKYTFQLPEKTSDHTVGSSYEIKYNPNDPNECLDPKDKLPGLTPFVCGIFTFIIGVYQVLDSRRRRC